jgi:hypothetical protein
MLVIDCPRTSWKSVAISSAMTAARADFPMPAGPTSNALSNCLPVKKNRQFPDFLTPALPLACGG